MLEIEVKARVGNRTALIEALNKEATFASHVVRDDAYWGAPLVNSKKIRIRREAYFKTSPTEAALKNILVTYKRKELRSLKSGGTIEVNDEKECAVTDSSPLEAFLEDNGFCIVLKKHKDVLDWYKNITVQDTKMKATFELCTVPPLGDFLEVEILSECTQKDFVNACNETLIRLLESVGLSKNDIERRFYSEMLAEIGVFGEANVAHD